MPSASRTAGLARPRHIHVLTKRLHPTVVTPHEEEFRRLGGDLSRGREQGAAEFVRQHRCTLVLKGPGTIVAKAGLFAQFFLLDF